MTNGVSEGPPDAVPCLHRAAAAQQVRCAVITVSDTRTPATDRGGALAAELFQSAGHLVVARKIVPDDIARIQAAVKELVDENGPDVIVLTGGTGLSARDVTPDALQPWATREIPGFGELFRMLSYQDVGAAAMLSRAGAVVIHKTAVFMLPGSPGAVRLAMERLILPELGHLVHELRK